jgi:alcohol dehydrogenase, propanol-preferring
MTCGWVALPFPVPKGQIGGHEGVGIVQKLGPGSDVGTVKLGDRVGIKWAAAMCGTCMPCRNGFDGHCTQFKVSGYFTPGTFAQFALAPANYVTPIPGSLGSADAAPMLCAGLTSYSALRKCGAKSGDWVVVSGAGGGLGHLAVQIATRGMGYRVIGLDAGSKEALVKDCGAEHFLDIAKYTSEALAEEIKKLTDGLGATSVIVCAGVNAAYAQALGMLSFGGTVVCVGIPDGQRKEIGNAFPQHLIGGQKKIVGSSIGNQREAIEVLELAARGVVKTHYKIDKLENLTEVFKDMEDNKMEGRV